MTEQKKKSVPLTQLHKGRTATVIGLPHGLLKSQLIRLGVFEGQHIKCVHRLPGGTMVIERNRQEIALGKKLAQQVDVIISEE